MEEKHQKAEERARKAEEKAKKAEVKAKAKVTRTAKRKNQAHVPTLSAKRAKPTKEQFEIDSNTCCICFGTYEEDLETGGGEDWIQCSCGKWAHEECIEECTDDSDGNPRLCPDCIEKFA